MALSTFPSYLRLISGKPREANARAQITPFPKASATAPISTEGELLERLETIGELAPTAPLSFLVVKVQGVNEANAQDTLETVGGRIRSLARCTDAVGRVGAAAFGIVLQGSGVAAAGAVAARLTHHLNRIAELQPSVCITVTAATGKGMNALALPVAAMDNTEDCCG